MSMCYSRKAVGQYKQCILIRSDRQCKLSCPFSYAMQACLWYTEKTLDGIENDYDFDM